MHTSEEQQQFTRDVADDCIESGKNVVRYAAIH